MRMVVASILVLAGTIAWAAAGYLAEAYASRSGVPAVILGALGGLELLAGARILYERPTSAPQ